MVHYVYVLWCLWNAYVIGRSGLVAARFVLVFVFYVVVCGRSVVAVPVLCVSWVSFVFSQLPLSALD